MSTAREQQIILTKTARNKSGTGNARIAKVLNELVLAICLTQGPMATMSSNTIDRNLACKLSAHPQRGYVWQTKG